MSRGSNRQRGAGVPPSEGLLAVLERLGTGFRNGDGPDRDEISVLREQVAGQQQLLKRLWVELRMLNQGLAEAETSKLAERQRRRQELEAWLALHEDRLPAVMAKPHIDKAAKAQAEKAADAMMIAELDDMLGMAIAENEDAAAELAQMADEQDTDITDPGDETDPVGDDMAADNASAGDDSGGATGGDDGGAGDASGAGDGGDGSGGGQGGDA